MIYVHKPYKWHWIYGLDDSKKNLLLKNVHIFWYLVAIRIIEAPFEIIFVF